MVECSKFSGDYCCFFSLGVIIAFFLIVSPWLAFGGPWVTYSLNADTTDDNSTTTAFSDLNLQYPMFQFERQQYLSKLCFSQINLELWMAVFKKDPQLTCTRRRSGSGYSTYRDCRYTYCLSDWDVFKNNRTKFSHNVKLLANPSYYLTVTDACWLAWWIPAAVLAYFGSPFVVPMVYTIFVYALRVSLSVASMVKFLDYNSMTDPPYTGFLKTNPDLQKSTSWKYDYGFAFGWIVLISNGIAFLAIVIGAIIYGCSQDNRKKIENRFDSLKTSSRRAGSRVTSRIRKGGSSGGGARSTSPADSVPNDKSEPAEKPAEE